MDNSIIERLVYNVKTNSGKPTTLKENYEEYNSNGGV